MWYYTKKVTTRRPNKEELRLEKDHQKRLELARLESLPKRTGAERARLQRLRACHHAFHMANGFGNNTSAQFEVWLALEP